MGIVGCGGGGSASSETGTPPSYLQGADPDYEDQWYLNNTGQLGIKSYDLNVASLWSTLTGKNIRIAIADNGFQTNHEDIERQVHSGWAYDYTLKRTHITAPDTNRRHATNVAGVIAATRNNRLGGHGVAPDASLINLRVIGEAGILDSDEAEAMIDALDQSYEPHIYSNSWGPHDHTRNPNTVNSLWDDAIVEGVRRGRGGLGTIYLWATGNGYPHDTSNLDSYANHPDVFAICAVDDDGYASHFSEGGDNVLVCAFGASANNETSIYTTDVYTNSTDKRYRNDWSGTSAAVPMVSGIIALMLEANPSLTWRDIREILIRSARKTGPTNGWQDFVVEGQTLHFHNRYGFGLIDASAALTLAKNWNTPRRGIGIRWQPQLPTDIAQNLAAGTTYEHSFIVNNSPIQFIESTHITISLSNPLSQITNRQYRLTLISPSGRESVLIAPGACDPSCDDLTQWPFSSRVFWGDSPNGTWRLKVEDTRANAADPTLGTLSYVELGFHGR